MSPAVMFVGVAGAAGKPELSDFRSRDSKIDVRKLDPWTPTLSDPAEIAGSVVGEQRRRNPFQVYLFFFHVCRPGGSLWLLFHLFYIIRVKEGCHC